MGFRSRCMAVTASAWRVRSPVGGSGNEPAAPGPRPAVLYLVPDFHGPPGGIALHARTVAHALVDSGLGVRIVALNDVLGVTDPRAQYTACGRSRTAFIRHALGVLARRPRIILLGHANFSFAGWFLARLVGTRLIAFLYGIEAWEPLSRTRQFGLRHADGWIAISHCTAARAARANCLPEDRVRVVHPCLATLPGAISLAGRNRPSILTVGRISASEGYKGHDYVIRAMPSLVTRFPDLVYQIVGDGDGRAALEDLAGREGVAGAVQFHGAVSDATLDRIYAEASLFVMPSRSEGFGFVFLEAMARGLPVVAGNIDATPEVVRDGDTGLLVDPTSVDEIVEAVSRILSSEDLRHHMGRSGQERVRREFGFEKFRRQLLAALDGVVCE